MNRKGFTLVELIATLVILALVMSLGAYSIISIINNSKEKNYELLINNIKDGAETYYNECRFANNSGINCTKIDDGSYNISLGDMVKYGYIIGNSTNKDDDKYTIVNPNDEENISSCSINIKYENGKIIVSANTTSGSCPTEY